jgi:hypothetical protein
VPGLGRERRIFGRCGHQARPESAEWRTDQRPMPGMRPSHSAGRLHGIEESCFGDVQPAKPARARAPSARARRALRRAGMEVSLSYAKRGEVQSSFVGACLSREAALFLEGKGSCGTSSLLHLERALKPRFARFLRDAGSFVCGEVLEDLERELSLVGFADFRGQRLGSKRFAARGFQAGQEFAA